MKIKFDLTCCCKTPNYCEIDNNSIKLNDAFLTTCASCTRAILLYITELDKEKNIVGYKVEIRDSNVSQ